VSETGERKTESTHPAENVIRRYGNQGQV